MINNLYFILRFSRQLKVYRKLNSSVRLSYGVKTSVITDYMPSAWVVSVRSWGQNDA